jgi:hypothetical protein
MVVISKARLTYGVSDYSELRGSWIVHNILNQHWEGPLASPNMHQIRHGVLRAADFSGRRGE